MKIIVLIACVLFVSVLGARAEDPTIAEGQQISHTISNGIVKSITWADPAKGTRSEIVVIDSFKKLIHVLVTPTTTFWDSDAKDITPDKIVPRQHVNVIYSTTPEGLNIGESIKILN